jgi:hypothetical protein
MALFGNNNVQQPGALQLGVPHNYNPSSVGTNGGLFGAPQSQPNPFATGMMGGMGMNQQQQMMMQNGQMAPPSEMEIMMALMRSAAPIDRFVAGAQMMTMVSMLNDLVSFSVLEIMKNAVFVINEDEGTMKLDVTSLPQNLQTMSAENVTGQFNSLQMASQQNIQQAEMQQQQIMAMAQHSMMGGALEAAMADPGMMSKIGGGMGSFAKSMIGGR